MHTNIIGISGILGSLILGSAIAVGSQSGAIWHGVPMFALCG